ncbi:MAG: hypothetical protein JXB06_01035, partial [Spirochaetales bacterium]|nr:hypothetical protein [Spirochaetales bacterium]
MAERDRETALREKTPARRAWTTFSKNKTALAGGVVAILIVLVAISAKWIAPHDPLVQNPYTRLTGSSSAHLLGTDDFGRDVLSRIIWGSRIS